MTLDEAIKHCEEEAQELRTELDKWIDCPFDERDNRNKVYCLKCAEEHEQLAEWLKELKHIKENKQ